jgi:hypothetical protein
MVEVAGSTGEVDCSTWVGWVRLADSYGGIVVLYLYTLWIGGGIVVLKQSRGVLLGMMGEKPRVVGWL